MELYEEILLQAFCEEKEKCRELIAKSLEYVELQCYRAIIEIKQVLEDESLDDAECFDCIEKIVSILEGLGTDCGGRHDFG